MGEFLCSAVVMALFTIALLSIWRSRILEPWRLPFETWLYKKDKSLLYLFTCDACLGWWVLLAVCSLTFHALAMLPAYGLIVMWVDIKSHMEKTDGKRDRDE